MRTPREIADEINDLMNDEILVSAETIAEIQKESFDAGVREATNQKTTMQIILTKEDYDALVPRDTVKERLERALYDARCAGIPDRGFQLIHIAFEAVGRDLGFKVRNDWTP